MCRIVEEIVKKEVDAAKTESTANTKREDELRQYRTKFKKWSLCGVTLSLLKSTRMAPEEISRILKIDKDIVDELSRQISRLTAQHQNAASVRFTCSVVLYNKRLLNRME